jgi:hypothetical protein
MRSNFSVEKFEDYTAATGTVQGRNPYNLVHILGETTTLSIDSEIY